MSRTLGIIIPIELMDDAVICDFVKPYLDDGTFKELKMETYKPPKRVKPKPVLIKSLLTFEKGAAYYYKPSLPVTEDQMVYAIQAIDFWILFWTRNPTKVLEKADLIEWANTIRIMTENDKRDIDRMHKHFVWMSRLPKDDRNRFWYNTVDSVSGIRKHWDKIAQQFYLSEEKPTEKFTLDNF